MWNDSIIDGGGRRAFSARGPLFALSLLGHGLVVAAVVVVPLLTAQANMAPLRPSAWVTLVQPAPPPLPAGGGGKKRAVLTKETPRPRPVPLAQRFVAPVDVPATIAEEDLDAMLPGGTGTGPEYDGPGPSDGPPGPGIDGPEIDWKPISERVSSRACKLLRKVAPLYPATAIAARVQGVVIVEAGTDIFGKVREARIVSGHPLLNDAALQAVRQWVYEPYLTNGIPRPVTFTVTVTFSLQNGN